MSLLLSEDSGGIAYVFRSDKLSYICAGSGGIAGKGGIVKIKNNPKVYAYNGDMITNEDYSTTYYEYDKDGNIIESQIKRVLTDKKNKKFIETGIYAQRGILRNYYITNLQWRNCWKT